MPTNLLANTWRPEGWAGDSALQVTASAFKTHTKPTDKNIHHGAGEWDHKQKTQEYMDAGAPTLMLRLGREHAYTNELCIMLLSYDNLNDFLPGRGWGPPPKSPRPFEIKPIPGKGMGMLAERDIKAGELIHKERLLVATPEVTLGVDLSTEMMEQMLKNGLDVLPERLQKTFYALHNCKPPDEASPITGTVHTNAIGVEFKQVKHLRMYGAIFPEISRVNHSCSPNAATGRFDCDACTIELRATRDIAKGSEITITYVKSTDPRDKRRKTLLDCYGFGCGCESCTLSKKKSKESDARRARLLPLAQVFVQDPLAEAQLKQWIADRSMGENALISPHLEALVAIEKEKDDQHRPEHCGVIAACYAALGDEENTKKWCAKADAYCRADIRDPNEELENIWAAYKDHPRDHPLWGFRMKTPA